MIREASWSCRQWEEREEDKEGKELRELEPWLQSTMTQSGCIHAPGENTQNMYQNTLLSPLLTLCNQCVLALTFPPLTNISMSLSPPLLRALIIAMTGGRLEKH